MPHLFPSRFVPSRSLFAVGCACHLLAPESRAETFAAGPAGVALLELYTSEGCSSCPPAERWFGTLGNDPGLWKTFVPVAFHVAYWDYLGWRDPYARTENAERQRAYADAWGARSVYTPGIVRAGREWRRDDAPPGLPADAGRLRVERTPGGEVVVCYLPARRADLDRPLEASIALLGVGLNNTVRAGENAGRTLAHDFVALTQVHAPLRPDPENPGGLVARFAAPSAPRTLGEPARLALAAWVSRPGSPAPLQAAGGWLASAPATENTSR